MCRSGSSSLLLSQHLELLICLYVLNTALSVETLVDEGRLPISTQRHVHSDIFGNGGVLPVWTQRTALRLRLLAVSSNSVVQRHHIRFDSNERSYRALDESLPLHHPKVYSQ